MTTPQIPTTLPIVRPHSDRSSQILPKGDQWSQGRPRWQFHLKALWYLLTIAAVALGLGVWIGCGPWELAAVLVVAIILWWQFALLYEARSGSPTDQEVLREEVQQWQATDDRSAER